MEEPNRCAECGGVLTYLNTVHVTDDFRVSKKCCMDAEAGWIETKAMLRDMGIEPNDCTFIEDVLTAPPAREVDAQAVFGRRKEAI